jgi:hypothetical protein
MHKSMILLRNTIFSTALCLSIQTLPLAQAQKIEAKFGWEPTFTNKEILAVDFDLRDASGKTYHWHIDLDENKKYVDLLKDEILKNCQGCQSSKATNKHGSHSWKITHPNGIHYKITPDPSVVEVVIPPMSIKEFKKNESIFSDTIFKSAKTVGLKAHGIEGQGHISIFTHVFRDLEEAEGTRLFRNFIVDITNHPELALGIFEYNPNDAPALAANAEKLKVFKAAIQEFDSLPAKDQSIDKLIRIMESKVYLEEFTHQPYSPRHDQAIRLYSGVGNGPASRIELRFFRPQKSFDEFLLQTQLIEGRLNFLRAQKGLTPVQAQGIPSAATATQRFKVFVEEAGQNWNDYKIYIPDEWKQTQNKSKSCTHALKVLTQKDMIFRN